MATRVTRRSNVDPMERALDAAERARDRTTREMDKLSRDSRSDRREAALVAAKDAPASKRRRTATAGEEGGA